MGGMTIEEALAVVASRNGRPREDDWELAEAATVLANAMASVRREIQQMRENEECGGNGWWDGYHQLRRTVLGEPMPELASNEYQ